MWCIQKTWYVYLFNATGAEIPEKKIIAPLNCLLTFTVITDATI